MIAGKKFPKKQSMEEWPQASLQAQRNWENRHPSFQTYSVHYMASQRRILFLADITPAMRFEAFETICFKRQLVPTTAETYWSTWLGVQKALSITPSEADSRVTKLLKARATAYPVQFPSPATLADMELLVLTFQIALPSLTAIAMASFILGQRISDLIQLAVADLQPNGNYLMITVRRGKTVPAYSPPYTLWLRRQTYPTETLIQLANHAKQCKRLFLFSEFNSDNERQSTLGVIRDMLASVNDQLELRSFRRGGLQRMANLGIKIEIVLEHSRHRDVQMLMRYLAWGQFATHRQQEMIEAVDATTKDMMSSEPQTTHPTMTTTQ
jgi:integrase